MSSQPIRAAQNRYSISSVAKDEELFERLNHELRTSLSIILMTTEILQRAAWGPLTQSQYDALVTIYKHAKHLQMSIEDVLYLVALDGVEPLQ